MDLNFDFTQVNPEASGGSFLPPSDDKGWLVVLNKNNGFKPTKAGTGQYLELEGVGQEGIVANVSFVLRFNLQNPEPKAVAAAYQELAALGYVLGLPGRIGNIEQDLFNKPFRVVSEQQKDSAGNATQYTQLARNGIRDVNGNQPKAGGGTVAPAQQQAAPQIPSQAPAQQVQQAAPVQQMAPAQQPAAPVFQPQQGQDAPAQQQQAGGWMTGPAGGGAPQQQPPAFAPQQQAAPAQQFAPPGAPSWTQTPGQ